MTESLVHKESAEKTDKTVGHACDSEWEKKKFDVDARSRNEEATLSSGTSCCMS